MIGRILRFAEDIETWFDEEKAARNQESGKSMRITQHRRIFHTNIDRASIACMRLNFELIKTLRIAYLDDTEP